MKTIMPEFVVCRKLGELEFKIDVEKTREDALLLAQLYAEDHFERILPDRGQMIGAMSNKVEIFGYRFMTNNGSEVQYIVKAQLPKD